MDIRMLAVLFAIAAALSPFAAAASDVSDAEKAAAEYFENLDANWAKDAAAAQKACGAGDMKQCVKLGRAYAQGRGVAVDGAKALALQDKACAAGETEGCLSAGVLLYLGKIVPKDNAKSAVALEKACRGGYNTACANLQAVYSQQTPAQLDAACKANYPRACDALGMAFYSGKGVAKDTRKAVPLFAKACMAGWDASCTNLGALELSGDGFPKDPQHAVYLFERACNNNFYSACTKLGTVYSGGYGIVADKDKAAAALAKACKGGEKSACAMTAKKAATGTPKAKGSVSFTFPQAQASCDSGDRQGCHALALFYMSGSGGAPKDTARAIALFEANCRANDAKACGQAGILHTGWPVVRHTAKGDAFFIKACQLGEPKSCEVMGMPLPSTAQAHKAAPKASAAASMADAPAAPRMPAGVRVDDGQKMLDMCEAGLAGTAGAKNCFDLGHAYANGFGVEMNIPLSMVLFQKACKQGHQGACRRAYGG